MDPNRMMVTWLSLKNLSVNFFDDKETQNFFAYFNENIPVPSKNQASKMIFEEFRKMQQNVKKILAENDSKFAFTLDAWSGKTRKSYYGITIHFIDSDWVLRTLTLDFEPSHGKHCGVDIANIFSNVLQFYTIENKIEGIAVDNVAANTTFISELGEILNNKNIAFNIEDQHFRCFAHVLNLAVQDILKVMDVEQNEERNIECLNYEEENVNDSYTEIDDEINVLSDNGVANIVKKIRKLNCKIRNSEVLNKKLISFCSAFDIKYIKPQLDSKTRWNSTHDMLQISYHLKNALDKLCESNEALKMYSLKSTEWILVEKIVDFLQDFKCVSEKISGENYITLPTAVIAFNCLLDKVEKKCFELDAKRERDSIDEKLINAFQKGRDKLLKHYRKCNWIYCISLVLDPRVKIEGLDTTVWGRELKKETLKKFKEIYRLYYEKFNTEKICEEPLNKKRKKSEESLDFDILFVKPDISKSWEKEIDDYLQAPRPDSNTKILLWWKDHANIYPIISKMAKDILCIPASSVPSERLFSEAALVLTKNRCSLKDESIKALICINRWMKSSFKKEICEVKL